MTAVDLGRVGKSVRLDLNEAAAAIGFPNAAAIDFNY